MNQKLRWRTRHLFALFVECEIEPVSFCSEEREQRNDPMICHDNCFVMATYLISWHAESCVLLCDLFS